MRKSKSMLLKIKALLFSAVLCTFSAPLIAASCLTDVGDSAMCAEMQKQGNAMYDGILDIDEAIQEMIYRSIEEGGQMLDSAIKFLKKELVNVKISSTSTTPIESSSMATLKTEIENVAKSSVATANQEILKELVNVIKRVESDSSFANAVARELGLVFSSKRKRRSVSKTGDYGSSVDGIVQQSLQTINNTLKNADLKMQASFLKFLTQFTVSIKTLLQGAVQLDFDQISQNMNAMLRETALLLVESSVSRLKNTISLCVGQLQEIIELASKYKSDPAKLRSALEPARLRIVEAMKKTKTNADEAGLLKRIDAAVEKTISYFMEIKALVS